MNSDPKLQAAAEEIKAVLRRYDAAACMILASGEGHSEYVFHVMTPDVRWSALTVVENGIRVRAQAKTGGPEERERLQKTVNMVHHMRDVSASQFDAMDRLVKMLHQHLDIDAGRGKHTPAP